MKHCVAFGRRCPDLLADIVRGSDTSLDKKNIFSAEEKFHSECDINSMGA